MCDHHHGHAGHSHHPKRAISLDYGRDHDRDHAAWSRRDFLTSASAAAAGTFLIGTGAQARAVQATSHTAMLRALGERETDRILVIIQLGGGNDGLNMVVPHTSATYNRRRPTIRQSASSVMALDADYGLNGAMGSLEPMWGNGDLAVIHSAGYPDHSRSHFRSTDIWASGADASGARSDGWTGRYVDQAFPTHTSDPLDYPVAIRIGGASSLLVRGANGALGMSFSNAGQFDRLAQSGQFYDESAVSATAAGDELRFVRGIYNSGLRYRDAVYDASQTGANDGEAGYPGGGLASSMASVARLIKGGLPSRIYAVSIGGFDTHSNQINRQPELLRQIADSVSAFYRDLGADADRVLTMTFSEFGRTIGENGSRGTDHAEASPMLLFGSGVGGGMYGEGPGPVLDSLPDNASALPMSVDFRRVYTSILGGWFGMEASDTTAVLGRSFSPLAGLVSSTVDSAPGPLDSDLLLGPVSPNPVRHRATVGLTLGQPAHVTARLVDVQGRTVRVITDSSMPAGSHRLALDASGLAAGVYLVRLDTGGATRAVPLTLVR